MSDNLPAPTSVLLADDLFTLVFAELLQTGAFQAMLAPLDGHDLEVFADHEWVHTSTYCATKADVSRRRGGLSVADLAGLAASRRFCPNCFVFTGTPLTDLIAVTNVAVTAHHETAFSVTGPATVGSWAQAVTAVTVLAATSPASPHAGWEMHLRSGPVAELVESILADTARAATRPVTTTPAKPSERSTVLVRCSPGELHRVFAIFVHDTLRDGSDVAWLAAAHGTTTLRRPWRSDADKSVPMRFVCCWFDIATAAGLRLTDQDNTIIMLHTPQLSDEHLRLIERFSADGLALSNAHQAAGDILGDTSQEFAGRAHTRRNNNNRFR